MNEVELTEGRRRRRTYSQEFKSEVIQCCQQLGVSVAAVARAYDLHPNLLRRWLTSMSKRLVRSTKVPTALALPAPLMRSPSQSPGNWRASISGGRIWMLSMSEI